MFNWFLKDYQLKIYNADNRKLKSLYYWETFILILLITLSILWVVINLLEMNSIASIIILLMLIATLIMAYILEENRQKREIDKIIEEYKNHKLEPFINLLRDKKYLILDKSLDNIEGIEWLLKACSKELERDRNQTTFFSTIKNFFSTLALPIMAYIGGTISSTFSVNEKIKSAILVFIIVIMLFGIYSMISPVLSELISKRKRVIEDLVDNLEYYKILISSR